MMKDNILKLEKATNNYILNDSYELTERLLKYIQERITANKREIEELIKLKKEKCQYEEIEKNVKEEIEKKIWYKDYEKMSTNKDKFIQASLLMPIGVIAIEVFDTIEVIKYFIKAIKSRNSIAISDIEYDEQSVKFLVLEIVREALTKFNIDENLIMILPYEECYYKYFNKVIYTYNEDGTKLIENKYEKKKESMQKFIYIEDKGMEENAKRDNIDGEILYGEMDEVIKKINETYSEGATIYTKNSIKAYKFINLVRSRNLLVNASLENTRKVGKSPNEMYEYRNIILPIPTESEEVENEMENCNEVKLEEEVALVKTKESILSKIKQFFKALFGSYHSRLLNPVQSLRLMVFGSSEV